MHDDVFRDLSNRAFIEHADKFGSSDKHSLSVALYGGEDMDAAILIPIVAIVIGVPGTAWFLAQAMGHSRKMTELKIREKELEMGGSDGALGPVVDGLCEDMNDMRAQLTEIQERLDFAERLLAAGKATESDKR